MLPSVSHNADVLIHAGPGIQAGLGIQAGESDVIVLIEAGGFYSRKYGMQQVLNTLEYDSMTVTHKELFCVLIYKMQNVQEDAFNIYILVYFRN